MSLFTFLALQPVEPDKVQSDLDYFEKDEMSLDETIDADALDQRWRAIVTDIESDPTWKSFYTPDE